MARGVDEMEADGPDSWADRWLVAEPIDDQPDRDAADPLHLGGPTPPEPGAAEAGGPVAGSRRSRRCPWVVALAVVALVAAGLARRSTGSNGVSAADVQKQVQAAIDQAQKAAANAPPDSATVYKTVMPSVVVIETSGGAAAVPGTPPSSGAPSTPAKETLGSGVVVDTQGDILTARHVVHGASAITVTFADGTKVKAQVASETPEQDIAVLKTDQGAQVIVPATLGGGIQVGDAAYTVGNPLGLVDSLTAGVVSGLDRSIPVGDGTTLNGLIQFDAAVNPGSSGGPLLNRQGQVVGIVTALANPSDQGFFVGIGFAVPIATAGGAVNAPPR